jgi:hypothetical protein
MPTPESNCFPVRPSGPRRVGSSQPRSRDRNDPRVGEPTEVISSALNRLAKAGLVVLLTKKPSTWLIVPPEQAHYGAPPVQWWLHDFLKTTDPDYYVALLSAARPWGSGHYALQTVQVALSRQ